MSQVEYRVIPAPSRGLKGKGVGSSTEARFAHALEQAMNAMGREGWDYVRADALPCEERQGLTGRVTQFRHMLVFRRAVATAAPQAPAPAVLRIEPPPPVAPSAAPPVLATPPEKPATAEPGIAAE